MYKIDELEKKIRDYTELILHEHDMNIHRNETNMKIYNKVVSKCMEDLQDDELVKLFDNKQQIEYFVRQTMLYLILE